jgi:hypothetical protein
MNLEPSAEEAVVYLTRMGYRTDEEGGGSRRRIVARKAPTQEWHAVEFDPEHETQREAALRLVQQVLTLELQTLR